MENLYVDTSLIGGCFDPEFAESSLAIFEKFKKGKKQMMHSDILQKELKLAPEHVRRQIEVVPLRYRTWVKSTVRASALAALYIKQGALSKNDDNDAMHIALATIHTADVIVSWNFKHMVNTDKIKMYNSINKFMGLRTIKIRSPHEL